MVAALSVHVSGMYVNKAATWPWRYTEQSSRGEGMIKVVDSEPVGRLRTTLSNEGQAGIYVLKL